MVSNIRRKQGQVPELIDRQTKAIEALERHFTPAREKRRFQRLNAVVIRSMSVMALVFSGALGLWELGVFIKNNWEERKLAENYANVGVEIYYKENNSTVAKEFIEKAIELNPDAEYRYLDAYIDGMASVRKMFNLDRPYTSNELNETYQALAKSVLLEQQSPEKVEPYILKGQIYAALKDNERARNSLATAIQKEPNNHFAYMRLGVVEYNSNNIKLAQEYLTKSINLNPDFKWAYLWKGVIEADNKNELKALEWFNKTLEIDPRFDLAYYNIGWVHLKKKPKDYSNAEKNFRKALSYNPDYKEALYGLGMVYGYQNQYNVAAKYLQKSVEIDEMFLTGWKWKGIVNYEMKKYEAALQDFSRALNLDPSNSNIYVRRAKVNTLKQNYDEAIEDLLLAKTFSEKNPRIHFYLANIYKDLKQYNIALNSADDAIKLKNNYSEAYSLKGEIYSLENKKYDAIKYFTIAIEKAKYRKERFLIKRAKFYKNNNDCKNAIIDFQESRKINKNYWAAWLGETECSIILKNKQNAKMALAEYSKLKPSDKEIKILENKIKLLR